MDAGAEHGALPELTDDHGLDAALEALLLVVDEPTDAEALAAALGPAGAPGAHRDWADSASGTRGARRGIDLRRIGGGWRFYTRDAYAPYVERLVLDGQHARLTRAALETLAVVAYRQPVTRARVAAIRGVNCDGVLAHAGHPRPGAGVRHRPEHSAILYRTTEVFLERLGLSSVEELPPLAPLLPDVDAIDAP